MTDSGTTLRRQARELALQVLFQREYVREASIPSSLNYFKSAFKMSNELIRYAEVLVTGIEKDLIEIDRKIQAASQKWSLSRMSLVDKSMLRVATYELLFADDRIPPKIAINEAIEIVKKYGSQESPSFVNGVLNEIAKSVAL